MAFVNLVPQPRFEPILKPGNAKRKLNVSFLNKIIREYKKLPGHYIKCVAEASFNSVFEALEREFGNIYARKFFDDQEIGVILGERYFLRVNSDVAVAIVLKSVNSETTEVEIISSAGASGVMGMTWSAHKAFTSEVKEHLTRRFKSRVESETSYFGKLAGEVLWKKCPNCRRLIPISSLTCPLCGFRLP